MTASELGAFRRRIGDKSKSTEEVLELGDASNKVFKLTFSNINTIQVSVDGVVKTEDTHYTVDRVSGVVTFTTGNTPGSGAVVNAVYTYSAFTDAEIEELFDEYGLEGGVIEAIRELLADSARLYDYSEGATDAKLSQVFNNLEKLLKSYMDAKSGYTADDGSNIGSVTIGKRTNENDRSPNLTEEDLSRSDRLY